MPLRKRVPTALFAPGEKPPVSVADAARPARFRGAAVALGFLRWWTAGAWARLRGRGSAAERARRLRVLLEELGGLWIKLGQLLSLRTDVFAPETCRELARLQHQAVGFAPATARRIVEESLGAPLAAAFATFEELPFAAASIAQIHRARLRDGGAEVAVKVRRPGAVRTFRQDLRLVRTLCTVLARLGVAPFFRWGDFLWELDQAVLEELDYRFEAENLRRMRRSLRRHGVHVPRVFRAFTTEAVLVMELVPGVLMSDVMQMSRADPARLERWLGENRIDPVRVGRRLYASSYRQAMEDNLFHADLHPGNIMLLCDSRIAFLDLGCIGTLEVEFHRRFASFSRALARREYARAVDYFFLLNHALPDIDLLEAKEELIRTMRAWERRTLTRGLPYAEKSQTTLTLEMGKVLSRYRISPEWAFLRVTRATNTLDASLLFLMPDANYGKLMARCQRGAERRGLRRALREGGSASAGAALAGAVASLLAREEERGLVAPPVLRREAQLFEGRLSTPAALLATLFGALRAGAAVAAAVLLLVFAGLLPWREGLPGGGALARLPGWGWAAAFAGLAWLFLVTGRLRAQARRKDYRPPAPRGAA